MDAKILDDLKKFDWQTIIDFGQSLDDLNDRQWRFIKGLIVELAVEKNSVNGLEYVGEDHRDYEWPEHGVSVELKSQLSGSLYGKKGEMAKQISIKLNNSNGTNKQEAVDPDQVADVLVVVRNDGAFAITKSTVLKTAIKGGDGWNICLHRDLHRDEIHELTGKLSKQKTYNTELKEKILDAIRQEIPGP